MVTRAGFKVNRCIYLLTFALFRCCSGRSLVVRGYGSRGDRATGGGVSSPSTQNGKERTLYREEKKWQK